MRTRFTWLAVAALLTAVVGFAGASAWSAEPSESLDQQTAASAPPKVAAASMVVYKSQT